MSTTFSTLVHFPQFLREHSSHSAFPILPCAVPQSGRISTSDLFLRLHCSASLIISSVCMYSRAPGCLLASFLQRVGDSNQLIGMIITQFTGVLQTPSAQGGGGASYPGLAHAKHLDGPSGREKRPMSAPVKGSSSNTPATRAGSAGNVLKED